MTLAELQKLPDEQLNVMLAELEGWERLTTFHGWSPEVCKTHMAKPSKDSIALPPRYCSDLNQTARVAKELPKEQKEIYTQNLYALLSPDENHGPIDPERPEEGDIMIASTFQWVEAEARQRTIALIATKKGVTK